MDWPSDKGRFEVQLETQDAGNTNTGWSLVRLVLNDVGSMSFCDSPKSYYRILSEGLHIVVERDRTGLEFGFFVNAPDSIEALRASPCHVIGSLLLWEVISDYGLVGHVPY